MEDQAGSVSHLLRAWGRGDLQARDELVPVVYRELQAKGRGLSAPRAVRSHAPADGAGP